MQLIYGVSEEVVISSILGVKSNLGVFFSTLLQNFIQIS